MQPQPVAQEDPATAIAPAIRPVMPWRVASVEALPSFRLRVRFLDGLEGVVDMSALIASPNAGVFAALADSEAFNRAFVRLGAVCWPGDLDIAPRRRLRGDQGQ